MAINIDDYKTDWASDEKDVGLEGIKVTGKDKPTEFDIFKLGKNILLVNVALFVIIMFLYLGKEQLCISKPMDEVWKYSTQAIYGFISLIIGFYFGGTAKK